MHTEDDLDTRFGSDAARRLAKLVGMPRTGDATVSPASRDRCRGALTGAVAGEALPAIFLGRRPTVGADTRLGLVTADAVLSGAHDHPVRFAARLAATRVRGMGRAAHHTRQALRSGRAWWRAGASNSAGAAAAARSTVFGLLWSGDPSRAAYEAALSATVTHGHPAAIAGAAAMAAAISLASRGKGPLEKDWLAEVADICEDYPQGAVYGATVADRIRLLPALIDAGDASDALDQIARSPVATEAIPAAVLGAATVPLPIAASLSSPTGWDLESVAAWHPACRAMMGACIGARHGEGVWGSWGSLQPAGLPSDPLAIVRGIDAVRATADRIAGRRTRPVKRPPRPREKGDADVPVHVSFLIDRSGSMSGLRSDVVDGFNAFVAEQREKPDECALTLVQFDSNDPYEVIHDAVPLKEVHDLTAKQYCPRGATPLLDALGTLIEKADARLAAIRHEEDQIVAVFTDGLENASRRWTRAQLFDAITDRKNDGWTFVFMGANQDSYEEAGRLGMDDASVQDFRADKQGVQTAFGSFNRAVREYRHSAHEERMHRKNAFFAGRKEAEEDKEGREEE